MDQNNQDKTSAVDKVLAFDTIFTNNHIKMLKVLLSYFDPAIQKTLAIYIKFLELQYTFAYFQNHARVFSSGHSPPDTSSDLNNLCREILPYCAPDERKKIEQIRQMQQTMENFRQMQQVMETMKELFPDGFPSFGSQTDEETGSDASSGNAPFNAELLSSLNGGENSQMFDMLAAMMNGST